MSDQSNGASSSASGGRVEVRDISREWFTALHQYNPPHDEILEVLQGMIVALGMGGEADLPVALDALERFQNSSPDEYTLGAIAMLMSVCQLQVIDPQESLGILDHQLRRWHAPVQGA